MRQPDFERIRETISQIVPITDSAWNLVKERLSFAFIEKNELLVKEGSVSRHVSFIYRGAFRTYYVKEGEEFNQDFYFENAWVKSYQSFLSQEPSKLWVQALEDSEIYKMSYNDLTHLYSTNESIATFGRLIAEYTYIRAQKRIESLLLDTPEERYHKLLQDHPQIFERIPLYHIASYLGIKQPSLSRLRARIQRKGIPIIT